MSKPLALSIGGKVGDGQTIQDLSPPSQSGPEQSTPEQSKNKDQPQPMPEPINVQSYSAMATAPAPSSQALAELYENLKRHEETLRDLIVEVRLLYHNLADKEKQRLETRRDGTTREVRDSFAGQVRSLEEKISRLRGGQ
jgi:hypothetical protein